MGLKNYKRKIEEKQCAGEGEEKPFVEKSNADKKLVSTQPCFIGSVEVLIHSHGRLGIINPEFLIPPGFAPSCEVARNVGGR